MLIDKEHTSMRNAFTCPISPVLKISAFLFSKQSVPRMKTQLNRMK